MNDVQPSPTPLNGVGEMLQEELVSGLKYQWSLAQGDPQAFSALGAQYNLSPAVIQTLVRRGIATPEALHQFLFMPYDAQIYHPSRLKDADRAVSRIIQAIERGEKILIAGDYDVDGITSTALMMVGLQALNAQVNFFLPHRVRDGYGLSVRMIERAAKNGYSVVITVDNGSTALEAAARAQELGIDLIITDHHRPHETMPQAYALVNPCQRECEYPFKSLAGVGVAFKVLSLLYERCNQTLPDKAYELLVLGTVADVVPLREENRYWVRYGLHKVNSGSSIAIDSLKRNAKLEMAVTSLDVGFSLAPQLNALGRLEDPRQGVSFLLSDDRAHVEHVGQVLHELNQARKAIERQVVEDIIARIEGGEHNPVVDRCVVIVGESWPPGVVGLVAARVVGLYNVPAFILHETSDGLCKGSARGMNGFHLFHALEACADLLEQFGGHAQAAGLSIKRERLEEFRARMKALVIEALGTQPLQPLLALDGELGMSDVTAKLLRDVAYLEPFGCENPQPVFMIRNVTLIKEPTLLKEQHTKFMIFADGVLKPVIFFNRPDIYSALIERPSEPFHVAVRIIENSWNTKKNIEFHGVDIAW